MNPEAQLEDGIRAYQERRFADAERIAAEMLRVDGRNFRALNLLGMSLFQQGRLDEGLRFVARAAEICPDYAAAHSNLAVIHREQHDLESALQDLERAIKIDPSSADFHQHKGALLLELERYEKSIETFRRSVELDATLPEAHAGLGDALSRRGRWPEALEGYDRALALKPDYPEALNNRGNALKDLKRSEEALASYDRALALRPEYPEASNNRGLLLAGLRRQSEALACYERAIALKADYADPYNSRGILLGELKQHAQALQSFDAALARKPDYAEAWSNRGNTLRELNRLDDALASFERALALKADFPEAHYNRGHALRDLRRYSESVQAYARAVELAPDYSFAKGHLLHARMLCCEWDGVAALAASVQADIRAGRQAAEPFGYQGIADSVQDLRACAEIYASAMYPTQPALASSRERISKTKIRIGYLSGEFRQQATSVLMAELFELHDKSRFEVFAFDNGWDDGSEMRARLVRAFDEIVDISKLGDLQAAETIRQRDIDILVNLNGYFGLQRQGVFSLKPCPVQVNYLGFPGTIGADYIDYIVADRWVIPPDEQNGYVEKVVYLPDCYQVNDSRRPIAETAMTRGDCKLPPAGFVFCCFNNNYKITPEMFAIWMRLLQRIDGSVLWLLEDNADAARNLRSEAQRRGIDADRLVFAPRMNPAGHLARQRLADLFLDTLPYNAHTTASDALWAGLPLLTCRGTTFPGRVATSLLNAVGLPELVAESLDEYERRALQLAGAPALLADYRARLARNRGTCRLYDTDRFRRHIEAAYATMWQRYQSGQPPAGFAVEPVA